MNRTRKGYLDFFSEIVHMFDEKAARLFRQWANEQNGTNNACTKQQKAGWLRAYCDECGKEYTYEPKDVLRFESELPGLFEPHRLFK